jgi:hypothetical protein
VSSGLRGGPDAGHAEADELAGLADDGYRVGDQGLVLLGEIGDVGLDAADQLTQLGDLLLARGDLGLAQSCSSVAAWTCSRSASNCCR